MHVELHVVVAAAVLAAGAGAFPAAEGLEARPRAGRRALRTVGVRHACFDLVEEPSDLGRVAVEAGGQAVVDAVGDLHGFVEIVHLADGGDGQEHLILPQAVAEGQVGDEGRFAEVAFVEVAAGLHVTAGQEVAAGLVDLFGEVFEVVVGTLVDDRAEVSGALGRVADGEFVGEGLQFGDQFVVDGRFHNDARGGGAFLSLQAKGRADDAGRGVVQIGVARDDGGVLAAKFQHHRADVVAVGEVAVEFHAHVEGAGEGGAVEFGAVHQRLSERGAGAGDEVHHAVGEAGVAQAFGVEADDPGGVGGGLDDDGVARDQRRAGRAAGQREGEVERRDDQPYPVGLQHRHVRGVIADQRVFAHWLDEALVLFHHLGRVVHQVGGFLHVAEGFHAVLAHVQRHRRAQLKDALFDQFRGLADEGHAFLPRGTRPGGEGAAGGLNRHLRVGGVSFLHYAQHPIGVDRGADFEFLVGEHLPAVNEHAIFPSQILLEGGNGFVEALVQFLGRIEHGGVG